MKYNPDWRNKSLKCYFCGSNLSVKYLVVVKDGNVEKEVRSCNKCVFLHDVT